MGLIVQHSTQYFLKICLKDVRKETERFAFILGSGILSEFALSDFICI